MENTNEPVSAWFELINQQDIIAITHKLRWYAGMRNDQGYTALMFAASHNLPDSIKALLKAEATLTTTDGYTALMLAASQGNYVACELLLHAEGTITLEDGRTALFLAASGNHDKCVFLLTQYLGSTRDIYGRTPLDYCVYSDSFQAAEAYIKSAFVQNIYFPESQYGNTMGRSIIHLERGGKCEPELDAASDSTVHRYTSLLLDEIMQALKIASEQDNEKMCQFLQYIREVIKCDHFFRFRGLYAEYQLQSMKKEQREITTRFCEQMAVNEANVKLISELKSELHALKQRPENVLQHSKQIQTITCSVQTHNVDVDSVSGLSPVLEPIMQTMTSRLSTEEESALRKKILEQETTICSLRKAMNVLSMEKLTLLSPTGRTALELEKENELLISSLREDKSRSQSCNISFLSRTRSPPTTHFNDIRDTSQSNSISKGNTRPTASSSIPLSPHSSPPQTQEQEYPLREVYHPSPPVKIVPISPSMSGMGAILRPQLDSSQIVSATRRVSIESSKTNLDISIDDRLAQFVPNISIPKDEAYYRNLVAVDRNTYSRLMRAVEQGNKVLIVSNLSESTQTSHLGVSAMMLAVKMRSIEVVRILKLKSLRIAMKCGYTALMECCKNGYSEMVCHLISEAKMQTKSDFQWGEGCTALMIACYYGHIDCARQLLDLEGNIYTPSGIRPRDFCSSPEMLDVIGEHTIGGPCLSQLEPLFQLF